MQHTLTVAASAFVLAFAAIAPASAQTNGARFAAEIAYADLDIDNTAGADVLINRLETAARAACDGRMGRVSLREHQRFTRCNTAFLQKAVARVANATVTERYLARGGRVGTVTIAAS
jgi:UrcA family protein